MAEQADQINEQEKQTRNEMLFTLSERDRGTLAMAITPNEWKRKEVYHFLKDHLKEYIFFDLDLTSHTYTSLYRALQELLPQSVLQSEPVQYLVSVTGLESSLYKTEDGRIEFSSLVAQLNFERELIFNQPYIILLWVSEGFDRELRHKAPDLMHWMSKRFVFEEKGSDGMEVAEAAIEYGTVKKQGKIPERLERIRQLEETWDKLCLHNNDKARLIKDKISLLRLLGKEYAAAFEFQKAEAAFEKARALNGKIEAGLDGALFFEIGNLYFDFDRYELALINFRQSLNWAEKYGRPDMGDVYHMLGMVYEKQHQMGKSLHFYRQALEWYEKEKREYDFGNTYHQIGRVYEEQHKWEESLRYYRQALESYKKIGNEYELGGTYHQIGTVYQRQGKWEEALQYYHHALEWKEKTGDGDNLGTTYHQIAMVYQEQGKWEEALQYYRQALEGKKRAGNDYNLGNTYHQIGNVYQQQHKWEESLRYYQLALESYIGAGNKYQLGGTYHQIAMVYQQQQYWDESLKYYQLALDSYEETGNEYELGSTYHQIGRVEEKMGEFAVALDYYEKAVKNEVQFDYPDLAIAQRSLDRIRQKIKDQQTSGDSPSAK